MRENSKIELEKRLKELIPLDNDVFAYLAENIAFCQEFLRVVLNDDKLIVKDNEPQKFLPNVYFKSSIVDLLCELEDGRIVNVEIQLYKEEDHAKRLFYYASMIRKAYSEKGIDYDELNDIIVIYLTKTDIFQKGSTVYNVDMNIVSDQNETIQEWACGLKVMYINTEGITNKNISEYLKLLTDRTTYNDKYKETTIAKKEIFTQGGDSMRPEWLQRIFDEEREEGREQGKLEERKSLFAKLITEGLLTKEQVEEFSKNMMPVS